MFVTKIILTSPQRCSSQRSHNKGRVTPPSSVPNDEAGEVEEEVEEEGEETAEVVDEDLGEKEAGSR